MERTGPGRPCERLGHPIPRNVIANMESGRRANLPLVDVIVLAAALETYPVCLIFPVGYVERPRNSRSRTSCRPGTPCGASPASEEVPMRRRGPGPRLRASRKPRTHCPRGTRRSGEQAGFAARTATGRAQQDEAERKRREYSDQAISAKYTLRYLRRDLRDEGATPPDLPPVLGDVDTPEPDTDTTSEDRL
jgi:hypothetical protein